jgi:hypothetical protein
VAQSAAPVREKGYATSYPTTNGYWGYTDDPEKTPELRWPLSVAIYDSMRRQDPQVSSVLRAVTHPIRRTTWRLDGEGCDPKVTEWVANDLGLPILGQENKKPLTRTRDKFSWNDHLRLALLMLPFGHMFFEQTYLYDEAAELYHLRSLGPRLPRTIAAINVARDGDLVSIMQYSAGGGGSVEIKAAQLVAYVLDREGGNWMGTSLLRPAYKSWLIKDRLIRTQAQTIDRNGMGIPVYEAAEKETSLDAGLDLASSVRAGDNSGTAIPNGAKLRLMGVEGALPNADTPIRYHDEQIARAVLAHFLNLGQSSGTGSYALGSTLAETFTQSLQATGEEVADTGTAHIVEDLVDINWGPQEPAPRIVFDEIGSQHAATAQAIALLVQNNVLTPDEGLEAFTRAAYGLPSPSGEPRPNPAEHTVSDTSEVADA